MEPDKIRFADGAGYEGYMGKWSQSVGGRFLEWLAPSAGLRWLDVGCGNGAFSEMLLDRCAPAAVEGVDPSEEQLAYARTRSASPLVRYRSGDAMALPFPEAGFDAAVMPLVIFFVPVPSQGVAEMARVVRPGGSVSAYAWDMVGGGFPYHALLAEMRAMGITVPAAPNPDASRLEALGGLWKDAGMRDVETREIAVERTFLDFEAYWATVRNGPSVGPKLADLPGKDTDSLRSRMRAILPADALGRITLGARANAVKGRVPS